MISRYKAAIFDMDGTLLDSMWCWRLAGAEYVRALGLEPSEELNDITQTVRHSIELIRAQGFTQDSFEEVYAAFQKQIYRHYLTDVSVKPGVDRVLAALNEAGIICCMATATPMWMADPAIRRLDLRKYFGYCLCNDDLGAGKHEVAYFSRVAERIGVAPQECLLFEDALYSIRTAKQAGLSVCAIEDESARRDRTEIISLADLYIRAWDELPLPEVTGFEQNNVSIN